MVIVQNKTMVIVQNKKMVIVQNKKMLVLAPPAAFRGRRMQKQKRRGWCERSTSSRLSPNVSLARLLL